MLSQSLKSAHKKLKVKRSMLSSISCQVIITGDRVTNGKYLASDVILKLEAMLEILIPCFKLSLSPPMSFRNLSIHKKSSSFTSPNTSSIYCFPYKVTKLIPLPECTFAIPKDKLGSRYSCKTICSNGKHKNVEIEVLIELEVTDTNPNHSRKGRAMLTITVPKKDGDYTYTVSATNVCLFDPTDEVHRTLRSKGGEGTTSYGQGHV